MCCIILELGCVEMCFAEGLCDVLRDGDCRSSLRGVPLLPLYTRGAGLHDEVLVGYGIGVLVGYNCTSCIQGGSDSILILIEASCSLAQQVVRVYPVWSRPPGPPSVRVTVLCCR